MTTPDAPAAVLPSAEQCKKLADELYYARQHLSWGSLSREAVGKAVAFIASIPTLPALLATARAEGEAAGRAEQWRACREAVDRADLNWIANHENPADAALDALPAIKPEGA